MPAITSTDDLIRLLREDATFREAARRELLGDELLGMPRTLVLLANELRELQETVARFIESTDRRLGAIEEHVATTESDVGVLKADVGTLKSDNAAIKSDVGVLKSDVGTLKGRQVEDVYRRTAPSRFRGVAGGLSRMVVLDAAGVAELADEGRAAGVITADEADSLVRADLVATAVSPGGQVVLVAEISGTVHQDDVERAMERAAIAGRATGMPAIAVVAGDEIARVVASEPVWAVTGHSAKQLRAARRHTA